MSDPRTRVPAHDPAAAVALLEDAGFVKHRLPGTATRPPSRLRFTSLIPADYPLYERLALVVQQQLADIGVDMRVEPVARTELARRLAGGDFEAYLLDIASGHGFTWPYWFWHSPEADGAVPIRSGYDGADAALSALRRARGDAEVQRALLEVDRTLSADPPGIFLCWSRITRAVDRRFLVAGDGDRDIISNIALWRATAGASSQEASP
jgi:ABC-type transport system substrate-binding protein